MFKVSSLFLDACLKTSCEFMVRFAGLLPALQLSQHFSSARLISTAGLTIDSAGLV